MSFLIGLGAGIAFTAGNSIVGGLLAQVSSVVDGVDGDLARLKGMTSQFGAFFDAVLDRYADAAILAGLTFWAYRFEGRPFTLMVGLLALLGALMVSYSRARAEASVSVRLPEPLIFLASRDLRLFAVMLGGLLRQGFWTLAFLAVVTNLVVLMRILFVRQASRSQARQSA